MICKTGYYVKSNNKCGAHDSTADNCIEMS